MCYYQEFWKVYLINEIMISKIKEYSVLNKSLITQIDELEVNPRLFRKPKSSGLKFGLKKSRRKLEENRT